MGIAQSELTLKTDKPFLSVPLSHKAELECCYTTSSDSVSFSWVKIFQDVNKTFGTAAVNLSDQVTASKSDAQCGILTFSSVQLNDSGLYCCKLNDSEIELISHGTYLQVYSECGGGRSPIFSAYESEIPVYVCVCLKWRDGVK